MGKTRGEKIVFGILMSVTMAIGMEVYADKSKTRQSDDCRVIFMFMLMRQQGC